MISERAFSRAFQSFWSELFPLLTPRFVSLFNEAYQKELWDSTRNELIPLWFSANVKRLDIIAEFAFRLAQLAHENAIDLAEMKLHQPLVVAAQEMAFKLIQKYEGIKPVIIDPLSEEELVAGFQLCSRYAALYSTFPNNTPIEFAPKFTGAGFLNTSEGDIGIGDTLIEVKTTTRRGSGKDLRQLIVYLALDANANERRWSKIGIFNPRRGTFHHAEVDALILRLSGGKPRSDVLAELIAFAESNEITMDCKF